MLHVCQAALKHLLMLIEQMRLVRLLRHDLLDMIVQVEVVFARGHRLRQNQVCRRVADFVT